MALDPSDPADMRQLAALSVEVGQRIGAMTGIEAVLETAVRLAVERIPGADFSSVTRQQDHRFVTVVATDERAVRADAIQYELRSGPCVDAITSGAVRRSDDVSRDPSWPTFGSRAAHDAGVASVMSYRLAFDVDGRRAGMNVYSTRTGAFDATAVTTAVLLAAHASWAVAADAARTKVANLHRALETSRDIGVALGVLMATQKVTRETAFELMRMASQGAHRKLRDVAAEVAATGRLPGATSAPHVRGE